MNVATCVCPVDRHFLDGIENGGREDVHAAVDAIAHLTRRGQRLRWKVQQAERSIRIKKRCDDSVAKTRQYFTI